MIIAELCQNHLGQEQLLFDMVKTAKDCGAWAAKIQSFFAKDLNTEDPRWAKDYDKMSSLELSWETQKKFVEVCKSNDIMPMTSVYTDKYIPQIQECGFQWIKIGSAQLTNYKMYQHYKSYGYKIILSTGGHDFKKIKRITPVEGVLHCVSEYPTHPYRTNLNRMLTIKRYWNENTPYGFSSHVNPEHPNWHQPLHKASFLGATFIEVHFTLADRSKVKDGNVSLYSGQLRNICSFDKLSQDEQLHLRPEWGMEVFKQSELEVKTISDYGSRWKV